ncbi:hypothetical protein GURASL_18340 [Geotalea uraniireducens]|uniref:HTH tetR-type domain-containing protein n=1 Tax=Geotalea uraniireducens TaxID=351604 RepID=A0ABN6VVH6_9BACT|nr:TetR/AcrR family transcriptional regulator [Geotalea uraniireducens]BDV42911.1 hypothetical protein GURASL_18340 [Geotalea uraniireducens]
MLQVVAKRKTREEILELSVPLFARYGYDGVAMRDIASTVGVTPAALYYHFPDKENLYLDVVAYAFEERLAVLKKILAGGGSPRQRLEEFITENARVMATDKNFIRLMQWAALDSNEARLQKLSHCVFKDLFIAIYHLASELDDRYDPHLLAISIIGLVYFHFEAGATRHLMPGYLPHQDDPQVVAEHVIQLLHDSISETVTY